MTASERTNEAYPPAYMRPTSSSSAKMTRGATLRAVGTHPRLHNVRAQRSSWRPGGNTLESFPKPPDLERILSYNDDTPVKRHIVSMSDAEAFLRIEAMLPMPPEVRSRSVVSRVFDRSARINPPLQHNAPQRRATRRLLVGAHELRSRTLGWPSERRTLGRCRPSARRSAARPFLLATPITCCRAQQGVVDEAVCAHTVLCFLYFVWFAPAAHRLQAVGRVHVIHRTQPSILSNAAVPRSVI